MPSTKIRPDVGCSSRLTQRSSVDLPEPEGPITQTTSPVSTWKSMPLSTSWSPNDLCRSCTSIAGACGSVVATLISGPSRLRASSRRTTMESGMVITR